MIQDIPMPSQSPEELVTDKRPTFQGSRVEICCDTLATLRVALTCSGLSNVGLMVGFTVGISSNI